MSPSSRRHRTHGMRLPSLTSDILLAPQHLLFDLLIANLLIHNARKSRLNGNWKLLAVLQPSANGLSAL